MDNFDEGLSGRRLITTQGEPIKERIDFSYQFLYNRSNSRQVFTAVINVCDGSWKIVKAEREVTPEGNGVST
jgi:hypothetical protein